MTKIIKTVLLLLFFPLLTNAQNYIGNEFRFAFLKNLNPTFNTPPIFEVSIHALESLDATVEYGQPTDPYYQVQTISINADEVGSVSFDQDQFLNQETLNATETRSFLVNTTGNARVYAFQNRLFFSDSSPVLPTTALGADYLVMSYEQSGGAFPSLFNIIGTEDNTVVNVTPTSNTLFGAAGNTYPLTLDAGEVITISSPGDLTGSRVTSEGAPIVVFGGHQQALVGPTGCGADSHMWEQLIPISDWTTSYPIFPVNGNNGDLFRILALNDATELYSGCDLIATIDAGEFYEDFYDIPFILTSSEPVSVSAYTRGGDCAGNGTGDPNMRMLLPLEQGNTNIKLRVENPLQDGGIFGGAILNVLHLVMLTDDVSDLELNGGPVINWESFPSQPELSYSEVGIPDIDNLFTITSPSPFWAELISLKPFDAFTMSLGSDSEIELPPLDLTIVSLGPDQTICLGETVVLDPGLGISGTWQDGSFQETFTVVEAGTYSITVDQACGDGTDEVVINQGLLPIVELPDQLTICSEDGVEIGIDQEETVTYLWSTGDTDPTITATETGTYSVTATSADGCETEASTEVSNGFTFVDLGPDQSLCPGDELLLDPTIEGVLTWQDGSEQSTFTVSEAGIYSVSTETPCGTASDEIQISAGFFPTVVIPDELSLCFGEEVTIEVTPEGSVNYTWSSGETGPSITTGTFGTYTLTAISVDGCQTSATTEVSDGATAIVSIESPQSLCPEAVETIIAEADVDGSFLWEDGSTNSDREINEPGEYSVVFKPNEGCDAQAFVVVDPGQLPQLSVSDTTICEGRVLQLVARSSLGAASWPQLSESSVLEVTEAGIYEATAINECGATFATAEIRFKDCSCPVFIPNAFTPNGDGLNDLFKPEIACEPELFELVIFNRWGEEVFFSEDIERSWNGDSAREGDYFSPQSVYNYSLKYDNPLQPLQEPEEVKGSITIIR